MSFEYPDKVFDVLIIGGGLTGLSIARDCAMRRLSVALLEEEDFGSKASGADSGLFLAPLRKDRPDLLGVRWMPKEIEVFKHLGPNWFRTLPVLYSFDSSDEAFTFEAQTQIHHANSEISNPLATIKLSRDDLSKIEPTLLVGLQDWITVEDHLIHPHRWAITLAKSAASAGAFLQTGCKATQIEIQGKKATGVWFVNAKGEKHILRAQTVVNCAGAQSVSLIPKEKISLQTTITPVHSFQLERKLLHHTAFHHDFKNFGEVYLWPREGSSHLMFRETTPLQGSLWETLQKKLSSILPAIRDTRWLSYQKNAWISFKSQKTGELYHCAWPEETQIQGLYIVAGVNTLESRRVAEEITDDLCKKLRVREPCRTPLEVLHGSLLEMPWKEEAKRQRMPAPLVFTWMQRYGMQSQEILNQLFRQPEKIRTVCDCQGTTQIEVEYCIRKEWAKDLESLGRRTGLGCGSCQGARCSWLAVKTLEKLVSEDVKKTLNPWIEKSEALGSKELAALEYSTWVAGENS